MPLLRAPKHAKPSIIRRKAAPVALAGGLSAGLVGVDVAAASAASAAASSSDLAQLRQCESGGTYRINTGNGYYGAYQFDLSTWRSVGMSGSPQNASPAQQDAAARRLQAQRGWKPWPTCSRKLGLGSSSGSSERASATRTTTTAKTATARKAVTAVTRAPATKRVVTRTQSHSHGHSHATTRTVTYRGLAAPAFPVGRVVRQDVPTYSSTVRAWQARMAQRGWAIAVDGRFGPQSAGIAAAFAAEKGLHLHQGTLNKTVHDAAWRLRVTS